jgi:hypothetical protein
METRLTIKNTILTHLKINVLINIIPDKIFKPWTYRKVLEEAIRTSPNGYIHHGSDYEKTDLNRNPLK